MAEGCGADTWRKTWCFRGVAGTRGEHTIRNIGLVCGRSKVSSVRHHEKTVFQNTYFFTKIRNPSSTNFQHHRWEKGAQMSNHLR